MRIGFYARHREPFTSIIKALEATENTIEVHDPALYGEGQTHEYPEVIVAVGVGRWRQIVADYKAKGTHVTQVQPNETAAGFLRQYQLPEPQRPPAVEPQVATRADRDEPDNPDEYLEE